MAVKQEAPARIAMDRAAWTKIAMDCLQANIPQIAHQFPDADLVHWTVEPLDGEEHNSLGGACTYWSPPDGPRDGVADVVFDLYCLPGPPFATPTHEHVVWVLSLYSFGLETIHEHNVTIDDETSIRETIAAVCQALATQIAAKRPSAPTHPLPHTHAATSTG